MILFAAADGGQGVQEDVDDPTTDASEASQALDAEARLAGRLHSGRGGSRPQPSRRHAGVVFQCPVPPAQPATTGRRDRTRQSRWTRT